MDVLLDIEMKNKDANDQRPRNSITGEISSYSGPVKLKRKLSLFGVNSSDIGQKLETERLLLQDKLLD